MIRKFDFPNSSLCCHGSVRAYWLSHTHLLQAFLFVSRAIADPVFSLEEPIKAAIRGLSMEAQISIGGLEPSVDYIRVNNQGQLNISAGTSGGPGIIQKLDGKLTEWLVDYYEEKVIAIVSGILEKEAREAVKRINPREIPLINSGASVVSSLFNNFIRWGPLCW